MHDRVFVKIWIHKLFIYQYNIILPLLLLARIFIYRQIWYCKSIHEMIATIESKLCYGWIINFVISMRMYVNLFVKFCFLAWCISVRVYTAHAETYDKKILYIEYIDRYKNMIYSWGTGLRGYYKSF